MKTSRDTVYSYLGRSERSADIESKETNDQASDEEKLLFVLKIEMTRYLGISLRRQRLWEKDASGTPTLNRKVLITELPTKEEGRLERRPPCLDRRKESDVE